ncbi:MAG: methylated-DNA--[protein]-cysteine S-methyltransferase [Arachnia sp.]
MRHRFHTTPVGDYVLVLDDDALTGLYRLDQKHMPTASAMGTRDDTAGAEVVAQLDEYFSGARRDFTLPLAPGGTTFQKMVWEALMEIPYAQTTSYGELAASLGRPTASRAVGGATGRNPLSIIVPCHRLVGSSGLLIGYAGGAETKQLLLDHERRVAAADQ